MLCVSITAEPTIRVQIDQLHYLLDTEYQTAAVTYESEDFEANYANLNSLSIPSVVEHDNVIYTVEAIGDSAFFLATDLKDIYIPASVQRIGLDAFFACSNLMVITVEAATPPTLSATAFMEVDKNACLLYVPSEALTDYLDAEGWSEFTNIQSIGNDDPQPQEEVTYISFTGEDFAGLNSATSPDAVTITKMGVTLMCNEAYGTEQNLVCSVDTKIELSSFTTIQTINFVFEADKYPEDLIGEIEVNDIFWSSEPLPSTTMITEIKVAVGVPQVVCETISVSVDDTITEGTIYYFGDQELTEEGMYEQYLTTVNGCDSIVVLYLTVVPADEPCEENTVQLADTIHEGDVYWFGERELTQEGFYVDTLHKSDGCDSVVMLILTVVEPEPVPCDTTVVELTDTIQAGDIYYFGRQQLTEEGQYEQHLTTINGCDSIVVLYLTVIPAVAPCEPTTMQYADSIQQGDVYWFGDRELIEEGIYIDTLLSVDGCDSVVILMLTVVEPEPVPCDTTVVELVDTIQAGDIYYFGRQQLTEEGQYEQHLTTINGCDSIVVLYLTVIPAVAPCEPTTMQYADSIQQGDVYWFGDRELMEEGIYIDTLLSVDGCDSVVILMLTVVEPEPVPCDTTIVQVADTIQAGESYEIGESELTNEGTYTFVFQTENGCDSIVILNLTVIPVVDPCDTIIVQIADSIFEGDVYLFGESELTEEGTYEYVFQTENGCDSIVILTLTVIQPVEQETVVVINGVEIVINDSTGTGETELDILGDSTLIYNTEENTLTFNNLDLSSDDSVTTVISYSGTETLTIVLNDSSTIIADTIITSTADVVITGEGTLIAEGVVPIIGAAEATITFDSVSMYVHSLPSHAAVIRRIRGIIQVEETGGPALSGFGSVDFNKTGVTPPDAMYGAVNTGGDEEEWINALYTMDEEGNIDVLTEFTLTAESDQQEGIESVRAQHDLDPNRPMYNILGIPVSIGYKGIIIQNEHTYIVQ